MMRHRPLLAVLGLLAAVSGAEAQQPAVRDVLREACSADFKAFCAKVTPGGGRIVRCLLDNRDKLSEACRTALDTAKEAK